MTTNDFLILVERDIDFNKFIGKVHPVDLRDDLKQDVLLACFDNANKNPMLINQLLRDKKVSNYVCRIASLMIKSNTSRFYATYRKPLPEMNYNLGTIDLNELSDYTAYLREIDIVLLQSLTKTNNSVTLLAKQINVRKNSLLDMVNGMKKKVNIGKKGIESEVNISIKIKTNQSEKNITEIKKLLQKVLKNQVGNTLIDDVLIVDFN
jgi:hypothetical protein